MMSPGTHLVKNHESLSITITQLKKEDKQRSPKLKILGPLYNGTRQLIWRQIPKLLIYSFKLKVQSFYLFKAQKSLFNNMHL